MILLRLIFLPVCLVSGVAAHSQIIISFKLPDELVVDSVEVILKDIRTESDLCSTMLQLNKSTFTLTCAIPHEYCKRGAPMQYAVRTNPKDFSGDFMGSCDTIEIDLNTGAILYDENHPLYKIYTWDSAYTSNPALGDSIDAEVLRLRNAGLYTNFMDFVIYRSTVNGYMKYSDLVGTIGIDTIHSYWINRLRQSLSDQRAEVQSFEHLIDSLINAHDTVLLKFWGEWCAPCLRDNVTLEELLNSGTRLPFLLGIQRDPTISTDIPYLNILDKEGFIATKYSITEYPTYLLIDTRSEIFRSSDLRIILSAY